MSQSFHADCQNRLQLELSELQGNIMQLLLQENHAAETALAAKLNRHPVSAWPDLLTSNKPWCIRQQLERLEALLASLSQLELKLYGVCSDCEAQIEHKLLQHDPACQRCRSCEERLKKQDKCQPLDQV